MPNSGHSLLAIRLTILKPSNRCLLGITWAHILGDAFACNLFIRHLAWLYVNSDDSASSIPKFDRPPLPTFSPHVNFPPKSPSPEDLKRYQIHQITPSYPPAITSKMYKQNNLDSDMVVVSLTRKELAGMVEEFRGLGNGDSLSSLDVISGWWIGVLQRTGVEIQRVIYTINVSLDEDEAESNSTVHSTSPAITSLLICLRSLVTLLKCLLSHYQKKLVHSQVRFLRPRLFGQNSNISEPTREKGWLGYRVSQIA
jgi:hypothetical protein